MNGNFVKKGIMIGGGVIGAFFAVIFVFGIVMIATGQKIAVTATPPPQFKENAIACTSATALDQMSEALASGDREGQRELMTTSCLIPERGQRVSVLDRNSGTIHVRANMPGARNPEWWTFREGLEGI